jgi:hypothetical protein
MGIKPKAMLGKRFGKWKVLSPSNKRGNRGAAFWLCVCDCGAKKLVLGVRLRSKESKNCGCGSNQNKPRHGHTVGHKLSRTYVSWLNMKYRCDNENCTWYHIYGGRGIRVSKRWQKFENFLSDMGERPAGKTLDRKNVNGNYHKRNCRWSTPAQQSLNRRIRKDSPRYCG